MAIVDRIRVAIVGGGIAGLALGGALARRAHLDVNVFESVPAYKDVGAGLTLPLNAIKAMKMIDPALYDTYAARTSMSGDTDEEVATEVIIAQGPNAGEVVAELGRAKNRKTIARADLLEGFQHFVPTDRLLFGKRLESLHEDVDGIQLTFTDNTTATADCVLAADGIHSVTRNYLLGGDHPAATPKNHDGWQIYRTIVSTEEAKKSISEKWTRRVPILFGAQGHVNCIPLDRCTRLSAGVAVRGAKFKDGGAPPLDPGLYADYSQDARQIVELVAKNPKMTWTAADHDHAPTYVKGRVAIIGDSAHACLPFVGNGAAQVSGTVEVELELIEQALEDVAVLSHLFSRVHRLEHIEPALQAYDLVRRPRSQKVVDLGRQFGRIYACVEDGLHEDPARMKQFFAGAAAFLNNVDLEKQNNDAMQLYLERISSM